MQIYRCLRQLNDPVISMVTPVFAEEFLSTMNLQRHPSPLLRLPGFSNCLVWDDTLHVAYRGFAADFIGSALVDLFGRGTALTRAFDLAHAWTAYCNVTLSIDEFSISDDKFPMLNAKAWDIKLLCMWLASRLQFA